MTQPDEDERIVQGAPDEEEDDGRGSPDEQTQDAHLDYDNHDNLKPPPDPIRSFYHDSYRGSFSARARRDSDDVRPSRSCSPPPFSRISTPIATPEPVAKVKEATFVPYTGKLVLRGHKRGVSCVRFSPDGRLIASSSADATVRIWSASTGAHLNTLEGHLAGISALSWGPDSKTLATGSDDKSIRLWDVSTGKPHPHPLTGHHNYIYSLAFNSKGNILVSGSYDEAVYLWDVRTRRILRQLPAHSDPVGGVDFIRDGTLIASCAGDGLIRIWDTGTGQCLRTLVHEDNAAVSSVRFSPNGRYVLAWTLDECVRLWDYVEGRCVKTYQGHRNGKYSLAGAFGTYGGEAEKNGIEEGRYTTEKAFVASGSEDGAILVWDVVRKAVLQKIEAAHGGCVLGIDTCRADEGGRMVSCGLDKTVRIWEPRRRQEQEREQEIEVQADPERPETEQDDGTGSKAGVEVKVEEAPDESERDGDVDGDQDVDNRMDGAEPSAGAVVDGEGKGV